MEELCKSQFKLKKSQCKLNKSRYKLAKSQHKLYKFTVFYQVLLSFVAVNCNFLHNDFYRVW